MDKIEELINLTLKTCESWVKVDDDGMLKLKDPIDKQEISAHYGATHAACSFIILGDLRNDDVLLDKGKTLLSSILKRWNISKTLFGFHNDFNNFALCIAYDFLKNIDTKLCEEIKIKICNTVDSNHNTINWLPMRWFVNVKRYEWTQNVKYLKISEECRVKIKQATNKDGGIEDVLPKGTSFNLQYDLATVAVLQFLNCRGETINLSKEVGFLLQNVAPDGDINYQGRGTNQIFAWGMWLYLLSTSNSKNELIEATNFLADKVPIMLENNNIMLNDSKGVEKHLWWDYHYSSVYISHFLFWLVLAIKDKNKNPIQPKKSAERDTGVTIYQTPNYFVATFNGRKKYIAETGPIISAIWVKDYGTIFKGTIGPWQGLFGNNYTDGNVVLRNYFGLLQVETNKNWTKNRIIHKLLPNIKYKNYITIIPIMVDFKVSTQEEGLVIKFNNIKQQNVMLNLPILENSLKNPIINLQVNNEPMLLQNNIKIKTQYGWCSIYQSKKSTAKDWVLTIS
ncbi:MAG: hypothetical protein WAO74_11990 [Polaribacter sp.]|uniref:hypothetical protein n=1 Tax=Polaribacter sp. TaxID=1920175 RepID=UPI003BB15D71